MFVSFRHNTFGGTMFRVSAVVATSGAAMASLLVPGTSQSAAASIAPPVVAPMATQAAASRPAWVRKEQIRTRRKPTAKSATVRQPKIGFKLFVTGTSQNGWYKVSGRTEYVYGGSITFTYHHLWSRKRQGDYRVRRFSQLYTYRKIKARGISPVSTQYKCIKSLWNRESGWRYWASNGSGAYGIPQALPGRKMASYGRDWRTNPTTQIKWGLGYVKGRYGTPCRALGHFKSHNWY